MARLRSLPEVEAAIRSLVDAASGRRVIVGLVGAPGSGKSTISERLLERFGPSATVLSMDGFHLSQSTLVSLGRRERMGAVDTFDTAGFISTLSRIRSAESTVLAPGFDRSVEEAVPDSVSIRPEHRVVIVEGNYLLCDVGGWQDAAPLLDASFFVLVDHDIRLARLTARHIEFGKRADAAAAWATGPDEVNARLIEATEARATHTIELERDR